MREFRIIEAKCVDNWEPPRCLGYHLSFFQDDQNTTCSTVSVLRLRDLEKWAKAGAWAMGSLGPFETEGLFEFGSQIHVQRPGRATSARGKCDVELDTGERGFLGC